MRCSLWILLGISAVMVGNGLTRRQLTVMAGSPRVSGPTDSIVPGTTSGPASNAPRTLYGTSAMAHPEVLENVNGDTSDWIDQSQYDQIRKYFLQRIAETPAKRDKLWTVNFSSTTTYEASVREHRADLRRMLGLVRLSPHRPVVEVLQNQGGVRIENVEMSLQGDFAMRALVFVPQHSGRTTAVIAIPPAQQNPRSLPELQKERQRHPGCRHCWDEG